MAFVKLPGVTGKVYAPEAVTLRPRKHACKDCFHCQICSDDRCAVCRSRSACRGTDRRRSVKPER
jgi:hypothetical protein